MSKIILALLSAKTSSLGPVQQSWLLEKQEQNSHLLYIDMRVVVKCHCI